MSVFGPRDASGYSCQVIRTGSPRDVRGPVRSDARIGSRTWLPAKSGFCSLGKCVRKEWRTPHRISRQSGFRVGTSNTSSEPSATCWRPQAIIYRRRLRTTTIKRIQLRSVRPVATLPEAQSTTGADPISRYPRTPSARPVGAGGLRTDGKRPSWCRDLRRCDAVAPPRPISNGSAVDCRRRKPD